MTNYLSAGSKPPETPGRTGKPQINKKNFLIISVTTVVYTLAQLPYLYFIFEAYGITRTLRGLNLITFMRISFVVMQTSCFINPIIYFLTNKGFRDYTLESCRIRQNDTISSSTQSPGVRRKNPFNLDLVIQNRQVATNQTILTRDKNPVIDNEV